MSRAKWLMSADIKLMSMDIRLLAGAASRPHLAMHQRVRPFGVGCAFIEGSPSRLPLRRPPQRVAPRAYPNRILGSFNSAIRRFDRSL